MSDDDLITKFRQVVKEEFRPIKETVEVLKKKVDSSELHLDLTVRQVRAIKEQQSVINEKLDDHTKILEDQLLPSVVTMEAKIGVYSDMYKMNNDNAKKLEKRVETLEENARVTPPPELTLVEVS